MGTSTRNFSFWRNENDLVKPITEECEIVTIPFRSNLGPELITKVIKGLAENPEDNSKVEEEVRNEVVSLCSNFPIYKNLNK